MKKITFLAVLVLLAGFSSLPFAAEQKNESPSAVTTSDPTIPTDELALLLDPLSKDELLIEAEGWRMIVKAKAEAIARAEIAVRRENRAIERTEEIRENAEKVTEDAQRATDTVKQKVAETLEGVKSDTEGAADLDQALQKIEQVADIEEKKKLDLLQAVTMLREERTLLVDNMRAVIDKLQAKTDAGDADTQAKIKDYRLYLSGVSGINVDVTDTTSAWVSLSGWVTSHEGGCAGSGTSVPSSPSWCWHGSCPISSAG